MFDASPNLTTNREALGSEFAFSERDFGEARQAIAATREQLIAPWFNCISLVDPFATVMIAGSASQNKTGRVSDLDVLIISDAIRDAESYRILLNRLALDARIYAETAGGVRPVFYTRRAIESGFIERARFEFGKHAEIAPVHLLWYRSLSEFHEREGAIAESLLQKMEIVIHPSFPWNEFREAFERSIEAPVWCPNSLVEHFQLEALFQRWPEDQVTPSAQGQLFRWDIERACAEYWTNQFSLDRSFITVQALDSLRVAIRRASPIPTDDPLRILNALDPDRRYNLVALFKEAEHVRNGAFSSTTPAIVERYLDALLNYSSEGGDNTTKTVEALETVCRSNPNEIALRWQQRVTESTALVAAKGSSEIRSRLEGGDIMTRRAQVQAIAQTDNVLSELPNLCTAALEDNDLAVRIWSLAALTKCSNVSPAILLPYVEAGTMLTRTLAMHALSHFLSSEDSQGELGTILTSSFKDELPIRLASISAACKFGLKHRGLVSALLGTLAREKDNPVVSRAVVNSIAQFGDDEILQVFDILRNRESWAQLAATAKEKQLNAERPLDFSLHWDLLTALGAKRADIIVNQIAAWPTDAQDFLFCSKLGDGHRQIATAMLSAALKSGKFSLGGRLIIAGVGSPKEMFADFICGLARFENIELTSKIRHTFCDTTVISELEQIFSNDEWINIADNRQRIGLLVSKLNEPSANLAWPLAHFLNSSSQHSEILSKTACLLLHAIIGRPVAPLGEREQAIIHYYLEAKKVRHEETVRTKGANMSTNSYQAYVADNPLPERQRGFLFAASAALEFYSFLEILNYWHAPPRDSAFDNDIYMIIRQRPDLQNLYPVSEEYDELPKSAWADRYT